jgi:hypothetical protein
VYDTAFKVNTIRMAAICFVVTIIVGSMADIGINLMVDAATGHHITATTTAAAAAAVAASQSRRTWHHRHRCRHPHCHRPRRRWGIAATACAISFCPLWPLWPLLGCVLMGAAECQAGDGLGMHAGARRCALQLCALQPGLRDA